MILVDVNVLVAAYRPDHVHHPVTWTWLMEQIDSPASYGMSKRVVEGFIRIVTHPGIYPEPDPVAGAVEFAESLVDQSNCVRVEPGPRQWELFLELVTQTGAKGNSVSDAWLAALAIESGSEWITWDNGYARYPGLRWSTPATFS